jgi:hypothetical protein
LRVDWSTLKHELRENMKELEESYRSADWSRNTDEMVDAWKMTDKLE